MRGSWRASGTIIHGLTFHDGRFVRAFLLPVSLKSADFVANSRRGGRVLL
jgi:hypothetical protein